MRSNATPSKTNIVKKTVAIDSKYSQSQLEFSKELTHIDEYLKIQKNEVELMMEDIREQLVQVELKTDSFGFESDQLVQQIRYLCKQSFKEFACTNTIFNI
jgi:arginyl-tRNA synthetase